jgi:predicted RNase H-like HicB family nuclease
VSSLASDAWVVLREHQASFVLLLATCKVPKDCVFWLEADGWTGMCQDLSVTVQGSSFEDAKRAMEAALWEHIENVLRQNVKKEKAA